MGRKGQPPDSARDFPATYDPVSSDPAAETHNLPAKGTIRPINMADAGVNSVGPGSGGVDTNKVKTPDATPWDGTS